MPTPVGGMDSAGEVVSLSPYVTVFDDFFTDEECEFMKALAHDRLEPAKVVANKENWYSQATETRNNEQVWLTAQEEEKIPLLRHILKRMHRVARVPEEHAEGVQVGRYNVTTKYEGHSDTDPNSGVGRPMTLIVYLSDVEGGGETLFPVGRPDCGAVWHEDPATKEKVFGAALCCKTPEKDNAKTVRVKPKKGRAVLFHSHRPDGTVDSNAIHVGCPVTQGTKWIAQRWFRFEPYQRLSYPPDERFDGLPATTSEERHFRKLSDIEPRLFLDKNFLTPDELRHVLSVAEDQLRDEVLPEGEEVEEALMPRERMVMDPILNDVAERARKLARYSAKPSCMTFRRLQRGGSQTRHVDNAPWSGRPKDEAGSTAIQPATVVVFLSAPPSGGEFVFPAKAISADTVAACKASDAACCAADNLLKVPAVGGDALLIYSRDLDGKRDAKSEHLVCAVPTGASVFVEIAFVFDDWGGPSPLQDWQDGKDDEDGEGHGEDDEEPAPGGFRPLLIEFENPTSHRIRVSWVNADTGDEADMGTIASRSAYSLNTYQGHAFRLYSSDTGAFLEEVVVKGRKPKIRHRIKEPKPAETGRREHEEL